MKTKLTKLLSLCLAITCVVGLSSCNISALTGESSSSEQTSSSYFESASSESQSESQEESNSESTSESASESDSESSSDSSSEEETPAIKTTVTQEEWTTALSKEAFSNYTYTVRIQENSTANGNSATTINGKFTGDKLYQDITMDGYAAESYMSLEDEKTYQYLKEKNQSKFIKTDISAYIPYAPDALYEPSGYVYVCFPEDIYSALIYNETTKSYTATEILYHEANISDLTLKFEDGKLIYVHYSFTETDEENNTTVSVLEVTFSNYETTKITLPLHVVPADVVGDGIITENEFDKALSLDSFENVKLSYGPIAEGISLTLWFDGSTNVKVYGFGSNQYWTTSGQYVWGSLDGENESWIKTTSDNAYLTAKNLLESFLDLDIFYYQLAFDGYTATATLPTYGGPESSLTYVFRFNEKEQLVYYSDGNYEFFFSEYGEVNNVLPF